MYIHWLSTKVLCLLVLQTKRKCVFIAQRGVFFEKELIFKKDSGSTIHLEVIQESANEETLVDTSTQPKEETPVMPTDNSLPPLRSGRVSMSSKFYGFHITFDGDTFISDRTLVNLDEPTNYKETMTGPEAVKQKEDINSEIQCMYDS